MFKNVASQKITLLAIDTAANVPKTGDAANITAYVSKDDGAVTVLGDTSASELDATNAPGLYAFDLTQAETNADKLVFSAKSSTSGIRIVPVTVYTDPASFTSFTTPPTAAAIRSEIDSNSTQLAAIVADTNELQTDWANGGRLDLILDATATASALASLVTTVGVAGAGLTEAGGTGDQFTAVPWNASWDAEVQSEVQDAIEANHLDHFIAVADPGGIVANSSFLAKLVSKSATPAFSSYDNTTDSLEANRDNIGTAGAGLTAADDAVITAIAALNNLSAAQVNAEVDTALADVGVTLARMGALTDWIDGGRLDLLLDGLVADNPNRPTRGVQLDDVMFLMVDATDLNTPETGITVTATISKDGGAFASCTNSVSEVSGGWYKITLTATEMAANSIAIKFTGTGCAQRNIAIRTQPT